MRYNIATEFTTFVLLHKVSFVALYFCAINVYNLFRYPLDEFNMYVLELD